MHQMFGFHALDGDEPKACAAQQATEGGHQRPQERGQDRAVGLASRAQEGQCSGDYNKGSCASEGEEFKRGVVRTAGHVGAAEAGRVGQKGGKQSKRAGRQQLPESHDCYHSTRGAGVAWSPRRIRWTRS